MSVVLALPLLLLFVLLLLLLPPPSLLPPLFLAAVAAMFYRNGRFDVKSKGVTRAALPLSTSWQSPSTPVGLLGGTANARHMTCLYFGGKSCVRHTFLALSVLDSIVDGSRVVQASPISVVDKSRRLLKKLSNMRLSTNIHVVRMRLKESCRHAGASKSGNSFLFSQTSGTRTTRSIDSKTSKRMRPPSSCVACQPFLCTPLFCLLSTYCRTIKRRPI